jgi:hypothetical protein
VRARRSGDGITPALGRRTGGRQERAAGLCPVGRAEPRPIYSGDGRELVAWLEAYRARIEESGAPARHAEHEAANHAHRAACEQIAKQAPRTVDGAKALAELVPCDCDGILRAAMLERVTML